MIQHNLNQKTKEFSLATVLSILGKYKWSIILITTIFLIFGLVYIHFKAPVYESYTIIKVKSNTKTVSDDLINNQNSDIGRKDVLEEISLLKTYKINSKPLDIVNFKVQYFKDVAYKKIEIFGDTVPIEIINVNILDTSIIGKMLTITPYKNSYTLSYQTPYKSKLKKSILNSNEFHLEESKNNSYGRIIQNSYVEIKVNQKFNFSQPIHIVLQGEKRDIFAKQIQKKLNITQLERDTSLIKISFQDTIPQRANLYINALTKSFIDYSIQNKNTHNSKTLNFITQELKNIKQELKNSEQKLELHQISKNIVKPSDQGALYIKNLSTIDIDISENKLRKKLISNLINFVQNNYNLDAIAPSVAQLEDANTLALITKLQNNQIKEEELKQDYTNEYPELKNVRNKILAIRTQIEYNLNNLNENINYENTNLLERKKTYEKNMKKLPSKERELVNIRRNYEVKSSMYEYLLKKEAENNIIQLSTFSDYQIIDDAYNSNVPIKPKRSLIILLNTFLGLMIGSVLAFLRYSRNSYISDKEDIEKMTSLPIYGSIPYYKQKKNNLSVHKTLKSPYSESFRTLRTNLQFINTDTTSKSTSILITSTIAGEGKSTSVANLATILEMAKYKTIIVNFDLRKPTLHKFFNINNDKGLSTYLAGQHTLDDIITSTEFANLDIISSGPIPSDPAELILSTKLSSLFKKLKELYEYVIIDTAPIGIISDTKILMQYADLNLIIIREDYARKDFIVTMENMIRKHNFTNVGLILNASKATGGEYGYGYSYEYK
ncbi:MAG: Tyrosine-protein kinase Wzc (EC [uncultured Sulfurovum sp.]|uniref:non-specific protein-tyrosine kinase n=1 Tax=uncultured Sulfurovum sp. TaxID=269237 RepID=A0A6S6TQJ4_9BACT|nr:MAG: Tyrosine-protein kinase Wzc (EC [uncultured Sulfurovum sp.]